MRICLIGDTHGFVPGLEAAIEACRRHAPDRIVHCGDFLTAPFSPDPPGETMDLLRAEGVDVIYGNNEAYLRDWGTPRWDATVAARRRRPDSPDYFLSLIERGQAAIDSADLEWLRALPAEPVARRGSGRRRLRVPRHARQSVRLDLGHGPGVYPRIHRARDRGGAFPRGCRVGRPHLVRPHSRALRSCESRFRMVGRRSWFAAPDGTGPATVRCPDSPLEDRPW